MKKIIFTIVSVCFVFGFNFNTAFSSKMVVSEDGSVQNGSVGLQKKYKETKDEFQNSTQTYKDTRKIFLEIRTRLQNKEDEASKVELKKRSFEYLEKTSIVMTKYLESLETKIQNMKFISDEQKDEMITKILADKNNIEVRLGEIESAQTIDEQKVLVSELRLEWRDIKASTKNITGQIISAKLDYFILKMEMVSGGLQDRVDGMGNGEEKIARQNEIDNYGIMIGLAKSQNQFAQKKFLSISSADQKNVLFKEGMNFVRSAHQYIKDAHKVLLGVSKEMRKEKVKDNESGFLEAEIEIEDGSNEN